MLNSLPMNLENGHPLISVALMTYNQEKYVKEALLSILNQTYDNLEIIVSDDCSKDGTWGIITSEIDLYRNNGGVHNTVILNKNESNLGVAKHFELILSKCHGEYVVCQAGDDVSLSQRIEVVAETFTENPNATVVSHAAIGIDDTGNQVGTGPMRTSALLPLGAMMAYSRRVYDEFGPISESGAWEDDVYARRAQMIGDEVQIEEVLMKYRVGCNGISSGQGDVKEKRSKVTIGCLAAARQSRLDLEHCKSKLATEKYTQVLRDIDWYEKRYKTEYDMYNAPSWFSRFKAFNNLYRKTSRLGWLNGFVKTMLPGWVSKCLFPFVVMAKCILRRH